MKLKIYTDGATSNNGYKNSVGGWAYVILDENNKLIHYNCGHIEPATNNICELTAALKGCEQAKWEYDYFLHPGKYDEFEIYSDSAYLINCYTQGWWKKWVENGWVNSKKEPVANQELWEELIPYFLDNRFKFYKVKGHHGDKWNEFADQLAVKAKEQK